MKANTVCFKNGIFDQPKIFDWNSFSKSDSIIFLCHASYELERSKKLACSIPRSVLIRKSIVYATSSTLKLDENYRRSLDSINSSLAQCTGSSAPVNIITERQDLMGFLRQTQVIFADVLNSPAAKIIIDISVFPKDRLFLLVDLASRMLANAQIILGYSEPKLYDTDSRVDGWLTKGVIEVMSPPGFNGRQDPGKQSLLILNMGHENERMSITISNRDPQKLILLAQGSDQAYLRAGQYANELLNKIKSDYGAIIDDESIIRVNSKDMIAVKEAIIQIYNRFESSHNIAIAFLGTKIQAIGALLACQENRNIEAVYAQPQLYHRERYSEGVADSFLISL